MTKSSRWKDVETGHLHDIMISKEKCEEYRGKMVQTGKNIFTCLDCGLEQVWDEKKEHK
ncbi:MAG: hypothetical protein RBG13Loki_4383 [Promethearchaeota archaeon CR_4]|nr:MAG: hypothetical protein RBG13Loki_4383 [Candidatus Lokiarchaeota archaeon CR_4]